MRCHIQFDYHNTMSLNIRFNKYVIDFHAIHLYRNNSRLLNYRLVVNYECFIFMHVILWFIDHSRDYPPRPHWLKSVWSREKRTSCSFWVIKILTNPGSAGLRGWSSPDTTIFGNPLCSFCRWWGCCYIVLE